MLRVLIGATRNLALPLLRLPTLRNAAPTAVTTASPTVRNFTSILPQPQNYMKAGLLSDPRLLQIANTTTTRNLIKWSYRLGKRKSNKATIRRFYRLNWGGWIRVKCGRQKKMWKKSPARKRRLRQHVLCNATQNTLLDKLAGPYWRKPKYFVDDPYEPYHSRPEFESACKKPKPYFPPEN